jgi:hypothetical protein
MQRRGWRRFAPVAGVGLALAAGAALRLSFHTDIEWKSDEKAIYLAALKIANTGAWPAIGLPSSIGAPCPGLSLWVFGALAKLTGARSPPDLAEAVQAMNVAALAAFAFFGSTAPPSNRRALWLWAAALWAVNPIAVILERKIWNPSILPLPLVAMLWAWWLRRNPVAAFAWGLLGALMAQIHMGVAFLALALAGWTWAHEKGAFRWRPFLAGSLIGALPAVPWIIAMARTAGAGAHLWLRDPSISFYLRWPTQFFGYSARYTLGGHDFARFLTGPKIAGVPTYLMGAMQLALALLTAFVAWRAVRTLYRTGSPPLRALFLGDTPETLLATAALWGYGGLLTLLTFVGFGSYRHYMIVVTPMMALWTAMTVSLGDGKAPRRRAPAILAALVVLQAGMSFGLLAYIDRKDVIAGEFGASWKAQQDRSPARQAGGGPPG